MNGCGVGRVGADRQVSLSLDGATEPPLGQLGALSRFHHPPEHSAIASSVGWAGHISTTASMRSSP